MVVGATAVLLSGAERDDPRTPRGLRGLSEPFLGTAVLGSGDLSAAVDPYGTVVDLRAGGPAGDAQIENPAERLATGTVARWTGIRFAAAVGDGAPRSLWSARQLRQDYVGDTNVLRTRARVGVALVEIDDAAARGALARRVALRAPGRATVRLRLTANLDLGGDRDGDALRPAEGGFSQSDDGVDARCETEPSPPSTRLIAGDDPRAILGWRGKGVLQVELSCSFGRAPPAAGRVLAAAGRGDRRWIGRARPLAGTAPRWAHQLYRRSLLALRALLDRRTGALAAGAREGWAYVWPRDAAAAANAFAEVGYGRESRRIVAFLLRLELDAGARFRGNGSAVDDGRELPGDADGWIRAAAEATGLPPRRPAPGEWRGRGDYGERSDESGDFLGNAIAGMARATEIERRFGTRRGLVRVGDDPSSGLESAAAWAARPFVRPALADEVRRTLKELVRRAGPFGIPPAEDWPHEESWTAPTAWTAWGLAALGERDDALDMIGALRRAATPAGTLPERVDPRTGIAESTTPLAWSHAFTVLALRELFPAKR